MKRAKAIELFLKHSPMARRKVEQLIKFEQGMSIAQYSNALKVSNQHAYDIIYMHGLQYLNGKKTRGEAVRETTRQKYIKIWNKNKTIQENADNIGISYWHALNVCKRYALEAKMKELPIWKMKRIDRIKKYLKQGLNRSEIARLLGLSRERIRQLVHMGKCL